MKESDIRKYAGLMSELGLTALEITEDNKTVRLEKTPVRASETVPVSLPSAPQPPLRSLQLRTRTTISA